jgi:hypothetical protein
MSGQGVAGGDQGPARPTLVAWTMRHFPRRDDSLFDEVMQFLQADVEFLGGLLGCVEFVEGHFPFLGQPSDFIGTGGRELNLRPADYESSETNCS